MAGVAMVRRSARPGKADGFAFEAYSKPGKINK
jgi:hypothetical protein